MTLKDEYYRHCLRDLCTQIVNDAVELKKKLKTNYSEFDNGKLMAYFEVLITMIHQVEVFQLPLQSVNLHKIDPYKLLGNKKIIKQKGGGSL